MRRWPLLLVVLLIVGGCDNGSSNTPSEPSPGAPAPSITTLPTSPSTAPQPTSSPPPGSVTLHAEGVSVGGPDRNELRVLVEASGGSITVGGAGGATLETCSVATLGEVPNISSCRIVDGAADVPVGSNTGRSGVVVRSREPSNSPLSAGSVSITYRPRTRSMTVVLPPLSPTGSSCSAQSCPVLRLEPVGTGEFTLEAKPSGGRPQLSFEAGTRTLATVEGGNNLSIRATVDRDSEPRLVYRNPGPQPVSQLSMDLEWP